MLRCLSCLLCDAFGPADQPLGDRTIDMGPHVYESVIDILTAISQAN